MMLYALTLEFCWAYVCRALRDRSFLGRIKLLEIVCHIVSSLIQLMYHQVPCISKRLGLLEQEYKSRMIIIHVVVQFFLVCVSRLNHVMSHKVGQMMWI